jgi:predicted Zn-dependent peptidase
MFLVMAMLMTVALASDINLDVKDTTLANGMKILVLENHDAPVFSAMIRAKVGSVDEKDGQTGLSHFLEHMMFKGTKIFGTSNYEAEVPLMKGIDSLGALFKQEWVKINSSDGSPDSTLYQKYRDEIAELQKKQDQYVVKDELWEAYLKNGGTGLNASTGQDGTQYYVSLPSNRLELWALLESDRFGNTIFREFYSEKDVVYEERRQRTDNQPSGKMRETLSNNAFVASGYRHTIVGWASDIETYDHELLKNHYRTYYAPNNLIAVIVGDVDADKVFDLCEKYFGKLQRGPEPPVITTREPEQKGEKRVETQFDANPAVRIGWHCPPFGHPDNAVLDVLTSVLSSGRTSRFNKQIVEEKKLASRAYIWSSSSRYTNLIVASATPIQPHTCEEVELAIYEEIDKLKTEPVSEWELQKIRNQLDAGFIRGMNSNMGLAWRLCFYQAMADDWRYLMEYYEELKAVNANDIMNAANKYLQPEKRTVVTLVRPESDSEDDSETIPEGAGY